MVPTNFVNKHHYRTLSPAHHYQRMSGSNTHWEALMDTVLSQGPNETMSNGNNNSQQQQNQNYYNNGSLGYMNNGFEYAAETWANAQHAQWAAPPPAAYSRSSNNAAPSPPTPINTFTSEGGFPAHGYDHNHYQDHYQNHNNYSHNRPVSTYTDTCDSPECHVPECHEPDCVEEIVNCTDPDCMPEIVCNEPDICHNSGATICAGSLEADVLSAAGLLATMKPAMPNGGQGNVFQAIQDYSHCMNLSDGQYLASVPDHPRHQGACMFTNAYIPSYNTTTGRNGMVGVDGMCHFLNPNSSFCTSHQVYHNINQPSFQNSTLQYAMSLRDLSSRASSSQDPFTFSTEQTPSSASTYSSPHRSSLETPLQTPHPSSHTMASDAPPICQWQAHPSAPPCGMICPNKAMLQQHIQQTHTAQLTKGVGFICRWSGCSRLSLPPARSGFAQRSKLDRHMQSHTGHKACKCPLCHHEFSTSQTLESHMRTHTGDKPFKCREDGCGYEAAQASQLTMHTRTKHTREKPLVCDEPNCGRRFAESSNLSKHRKIHEPEEECRCAVCGKGFRRRDQLRRHGKIHLRKEGSGASGPASTSGERERDRDTDQKSLSSASMSSAILPGANLRMDGGSAQSPRGGGSGAGQQRSVDGFNNLPRRAYIGSGSVPTSSAPSRISDRSELEESRQLLSPSPTVGDFGEEELEGAAAMMAMDGFIDRQALAAPVGLVQGSLEGLD